MNAIQLPLLFQAAFCEPVALELSTYYNVAAFLLPRMTGKASATDLGEALAADKPHKYGHRRSSFAAPMANRDGSVDGRYYNTLEGRSDVAVIPWNGMMVKSAGFLQEMCGGAVSHERLAHAIAQARAEKEITTVVFDINSPGGTVLGTPELCAVAAQLSREKMTYAFTDGVMASAAVYAGIQARETYLTPSAKIGSVGTILGVLDDSVRMQMEGLKLELFTAGKHKGLGSSGRSLSEDDRKYLQSIVEEANAGFIAAVKAARPGVAKEALTDAKVYTGHQATRVGLADGLVSSWEEFASLL